MSDGITPLFQRTVDFGFIDLEPFSVFDNFKKHIIFLAGPLM